MDLRIAKDDNGAELIVKDQVIESMSASELLALSAELREFVIDNAEDFEDTPFKKINFRGESFFIYVTENFSFWELLENGNWEPHTFDVFDRYLDDRTCFIDIGGWIGSTTLYAAAKANKVLVFEPDPSAFAELETNLRLNKKLGNLQNIIAFPTAIAPQTGRVRLGVRHEGGDSMSSVLLAASNDFEVKSLELAEVIEEHKLWKESLFVKMDVEGFEYDIIPSLAEVVDNLTSAKFLISLHPQFLLEKLRKEAGGGKLAETKVRRLFFRNHQTIFKVFKNYRCTYVNGNPFKFKREMAKSLITGQFPRDLLFTRE